MDVHRKSVMTENSTADLESRRSQVVAPASIHFSDPIAVIIQVQRVESRN